METRASNVLVGGVVLLLAGALFAFILWLARFDGGEEKSAYDIFFTSVSGLAQGSAVNFAGVPVGQVQAIRLNPASPETVRVRVLIDRNVPVLVGTRATLEGVGFTGVSVVNLEGSMSGQAPLSALGPYGAPVIATKPGTFEQLAKSAPELLNDASRLVNNLNAFLDAGNRARVEQLLENLNRATMAYGAQAPALGATLREARLALAEANRAAAGVRTLAERSTAVVDRDAVPLLAQLRATTARADAALARVEGAAAAAEPGLEELRQTTLPEARALMRDLRVASESLGALSGRIETDGAAGLLGPRRLPDYVPAEAP